MTRLPALTVDLAHTEGLTGSDPRGVLDLAADVDAVGVEQLAVSDHVVISRDVSDYPGGGFRYPSDHPFPDPLITLAGIAAVTHRARLSTNILIAALRPAVVLAKMVATLDRLAEGRLDLGVGSGWHRDEFDAVGVPYEQRVARTEDTVRACQALWRDAPASFTSGAVSFDEVYCSPAPVQDDIPIWFGGAASASVARRVARLGHGWTCMSGLPLADVRRGAGLIAAACDELGRDPGGIAVRVMLPAVGIDDGPGTVERLVQEAGAAGQAGATHVQLRLSRFVERADDVIPALTRLVEAFRTA